MSTEVTYLLAGYLVLVAVLALVATRAPGLDQVARSGATVALAATILLTAVDLATLAAGHRPEELLAHLGYAVAAVGIGPILVRRTRLDDPTAEPTDASLPMVALAMVTTAVVVVRLGQTYR